MLDVSDYMCFVFIKHLKPKNVVCDGAKHSKWSMCRKVQGSNPTSRAYIDEGARIASPTAAAAVPLLYCAKWDGVTSAS